VLEEVLEHVQAHALSQRWRSFDGHGASVTA
jgi:hypothetical protein